ncbi:MAG: hypothetical protein RL701_756 [Pseudomonadota bacterium]
MCVLRTRLCQAPAWLRAVLRFACDLSDELATPIHRCYTTQDASHREDTAWPHGSILCSCTRTTDTQAQAASSVSTRCNNYERRSLVRRRFACFFLSGINQVATHRTCHCEYSFSLDIVKLKFARRTFVDRRLDEPSAKQCNAICEPWLVHRSATPDHALGYSVALVLVTAVFVCSAGRMCHCRFHPTAACAPPVRRVAMSHSRYRWWRSFTHALAGPRPRARTHKPSSCCIKRPTSQSAAFRVRCARLPADCTVSCIVPTAALLARFRVESRARGRHACAGYRRFEPSPSSGLGHQCFLTMYDIADRWLRRKLPLWNERR